jgi:hypothetical protein
MCSKPRKYWLKGERVMDLRKNNRETRNDWRTRTTKKSGMMKRSLAKQAENLKRRSL